MTVGFWHLLTFVGVLLAFALAIFITCLWFLNRFLNKKYESDKERSESCHNFQRELNKQVLVGFEKNYAALSLNTQVLTLFMERMDATKPPEPKGQ